MNLDKIVGEMIKKAQERGKFDNLPSKGKLIDLIEYFEMPEDVRVAQAMLKNAGMALHEVDLLKEIAQLRQTISKVTHVGNRLPCQYLLCKFEYDGNGGSSQRAVCVHHI